MARLGMLIDVTRCTGCFNCFLACRDEYFENEYPPYSAAQPLDGQFWMQVEEVERGSYPKPKLSYIPMPCMQCRSAPCIEAAEDGAAYRRSDGIVIVDPEKARGQEAIARACPYGVVFWNRERSIPQKCTFCAHRLDEGERQPRCVESCPTGALIFGDLDDPQSDVARIWASTEALRPELGADPLVRYVGLPTRFIAGEVVLGDRQDECTRGVAVTLEGSSISLRTVSDAFGEFEFEGLAPDIPYVVTVSYPGYSPVSMEAVTRGDVNLGEIILERA